MNFNVDYFKIEHNNVAPAQGKVLISEPFLQDTYFKRSVILLTSNEDGFFVGFVLNKSANIKIHDAVKDFPHSDALVSIGGPVRTDSIHYIHTAPDVITNSVKVFDNLYWGGDFNSVKKGIADGLLRDTDIRFFMGYSGWEPKQLEREISENSWLVSDIDVSTIMAFESDLWKKAVNQVGDRYKIWANYPEDPNLN